MSLPEHLKHDEEEVESIIEQERNIENHVETVSKKLHKLKEMEEEAERYKKQGKDEEAERLEEEITKLNREILKKDFKHIIRQIRKGENETGKVLSNMPVEKIDVEEMKRLTSIAEVIEEHFKPKQNLGDPESNLYSSGEPEIAQNPDEQRGNNNYPNEKISNKGVEGRKFQEEEVIILQKLSMGTYWYNYSGAIYEITSLGDEIIEDLELAKNEIERLQQELEEDEEIIERAEKTSESKNIKDKDKSEERDLKKAEEAVKDMKTELEELIRHHKEEKKKLNEYANHLEEFKNASEESLEFVENVISYVEKFRQSNRRDQDLEKHIEQIMAQNPSELVKELEKAVEYSEKAEKEIEISN